VGNVFQRAGRGVLVGGGRDNVIENNLFVDTVAGVQVDARGTTWAQGIVNDRQSPLWRKWDEVMELGSPYLQRYPELARLERDQPAIPKGNRIERNVFQCEITIDLHDGLGVDTVALLDNWLHGDAQLTADLVGHLQLADRSPARGLGIAPIAWDEIGLQPDRLSRIVGWQREPDVK
jgi:hypothetical protein